MTITDEMVERALPDEIARLIERADRVIGWCDGNDDVRCSIHGLARELRDALQALAQENAGLKNNYDLQSQDIADKGNRITELEAEQETLQSITDQCKLECARAEKAEAERDAIREQDDRGMRATRRTVHDRFNSGRSRTSHPRSQATD